MIKITLKRIIRAGYLSFRRNGWLSTATILVISMALFVLGGLIFLQSLSGTVLNSLESKIDITVYFSKDAPEDGIMSVKKDLEGLPDVKNAVYVSRDQALADFRETHKSNALIADALDEIGDNPLEASLNIKAVDPSNYGAISNFLLNKNYPIVDKINYFENQKVIERLGAIFGTVRGTGAAVVLFLAFVAILVAFNTIRLAIYTLREEIGIMRLVGAGSWFVRGPFLVSGIIYGALAAFATLLLFFPLTWLISPKLLSIVPNFDLFQYFLSNFWELFMILLIAGILLGTVSSFIAMRRYLKA